jgi:hypothetical protein
MTSLIERHRDQILGVLSCLDQVVIRGTLPSVCHAEPMATTLDSRGIRLFDCAAEFAQPFRKSIRAHAERVAADEGIEIEYIKKPKGYRKKIASARSWPSEGLIRAGSVEVYYHFYFIDEVLGLCFLARADVVVTARLSARS